MRWLDLLKRDPVPWLLDPENPSARLLTLRHLFKKSEADLSVEYARLLAWTPITTLREHWNRGHFWGREADPYFGGALGNFGTLYLLTQLGVPIFPEVAPVCENLLDRGRSDNGRFVPTGITGSPWLCYTDMALQVMQHFGYGNDLRARSARLALLQAILLRSEMLVCPIANGDCTHGLVKALAGLLSIPSEQREADESRAIAVLGELLINYPYDFGKQDSEWLQPTFPRYYRSDLIELCHVLVQTPYRASPRFQELLRRMVELQTAEGRWNKSRATPALTVERIHSPSRWLTFEAVHTLTLAYGDDIYAA